MTGDGWTHAAELETLRLWARGVRVAVEVGTWTGRSASAICTGMDEGGGGTLFCVDHFMGAQNLEDVYVEVATPEGRAGVREAWRTRMFPWVSTGRCFLLETESATAAKLLTCMLQTAQLPSLIFLDGDHHNEAIARDLDLWQPLLAAGGVLCGHDYPEVRGTVDARFGHLRGDKRLVVGPLTLWRIRL